MERRRSERKTVHLKAERLSGNERHAVFIENISEHGIHIITAPSDSASDFPPNTPLDLRFQLSSGETIELHCIVRWSHQKTPPDGMTSSIGMEIIDPPLRYVEFVRKLP
jgi:hypothetical protein